jgi:glycerol-3-phosphate acyltransferase PlsY
MITIMTIITPIMTPTLMAIIKIIRMSSCSSVVTFIVHNHKMMDNPSIT